MIFAMDHFQHYSPCPPSFTVPPYLPYHSDSLPMQTSHSPLVRAPSVREDYFPVSPVSTSRQRTAQACDKCRERKTKCSGEKPVCQRCANRGLVCEYTCRAPRMRGPSRTRSMSISTPLITAGDEKQKNSSLPSLTRGNFSRSYPTIIPAGYTGYVPTFAASKHSSSSSPELRTESRAYSVMYHPSWVDSRLRPPGPVLLPDYDGSQLRMTVTAPRETIKIDHDLYRSSKHLQKRHNSLSDSVLNSTLSSTFNAQVNPRYNNSDQSSLYQYPTRHIAESSLSGSSGSSSPGYHSSSALSSSAPTPPFYSRESLEDTTPPEVYGGLVMSDYTHDTTGKHIDQNDGLVPVKHSYGSKDAGIQEGWSMIENSIIDCKQQALCSLWL